MTDPLDADVTRVTRAFADLRKENNGLRELADQLEKSLAIERGENDRLRQRVKDVEYELGFYLRFTTEMVTQHNTVRDIQDRVMERCREAALQLGQSGELAPSEAPKFLTDAMLEPTKVSRRF